MIKTITIGKQIAAFRKEKKLSQQKLADLLFVTRTTIAHWESGRHSPSLNQLISMCDVFDITLNEFVEGCKKAEENGEEKTKSHKKCIFRAFGIIFAVLCISACVVLGVMSYNKNRNQVSGEVTVTPSASAIIEESPTPIAFKP